MATIGTTTLRDIGDTTAGTPPQDMKTTERHKDAYGPAHNAQTESPVAIPPGDKVARRRASVEQRDWAQDRPATTSNTTPGRDSPRKPSPDIGHGQGQAGEKDVDENDGGEKDVGENEVGEKDVGEKDACENDEPAKVQSQDPGVLFFP